MQLLCFSKKNHQYKESALLFFLLDIFQMIDDKNVQHQIYLGTYRRDTTSLPPPFHWPLSLSNKWQYVCLNLAEVASSVFRTKYVETVKVKVCVHKFLQMMAALLHINTNSLLYFLFLPLRFMQTVTYEEYISPTDYTLIKSCQVIIRWTLP